MTTWITLTAFALIPLLLWHRELIRVFAPEGNEQLEKWASEVVKVALIVGAIALVIMVAIPMLIGLVVILALGLPFTIILIIILGSIDW